MRKRTTRKASAAAFLVSPPPPSASTAATTSPTPAESPAVKFDFDLNAFAADIASKKKSNTKGTARVSGSKRMQPTGFSPTAQQSLKNMKTIADLKELKEKASSSLDSIKHQLQRSHSEILKDAESSNCRLHKRYKIQTQECERVMDEVEKEYKKMYDRIVGGREAMKASYVEFIAAVHASASRLCKTSIPQLGKNSEKRISALKSRLGIS